MKKIILITTLFISLFGNSQDISSDLSLARSGTYVLGVYVFVECDPVNRYDYVGKIDKFDIFESDRKTVEKIIEKAKKKNPYFNGMIFKHDFKHVELIKFVVAEERVKGFQIGDRVRYTRYTTPIEATIIQINDGRDRVILEYIDEKGETKYDGVSLRVITKIE